jgi:hypothetical protein
LGAKKTVKAIIKTVTPQMLSDTLGPFELVFPVAGEMETKSNVINAIKRNETPE